LTFQIFEKVEPDDDWSWYFLKACILYPDYCQ
jgi:hypothetical protein